MKFYHIHLKKWEYMMVIERMFAIFLAFYPYLITIKEHKGFIALINL